MHVAVVIVGYRNSDDVLRCIAALEQSEYADYEVVVCENGGRAAYDELTRRAPTRLKGGQAVRIIDGGANLGFAGGVNVGLSEAAGADAWWLLNPDTEASPGAMGRLVERLSRGDCDAVGSALHWPDGRAQSYGGTWQSWLARAVGIGHDGVFRTAAEVERRLGYLCGASMMVARRFVETTGPMREDYFLYCEETEWCLRATARRMRLGSAPDAVVLHHHGTTTGDDVDRRRRSRLCAYLLERNGILLTRDRFPSHLPVVIVASLGLLVLRYAKSAAWPQLGHGLAGWLAGVMNRRGAPTWLTV
ncbi:MAG: glycosyltransferase family 2 protein [Caulobacteraceae bacterium]|nr:glycosyltransferase family 2 protein [Caulobacteraceae bacterium]